MPLFVCHLLAVYDFHFRSIPFQELRSFLPPTPDTAFHFHSNHTLQHPSASVVTFLSIPQAPLISQSLPKHFPHAFPVVCIYFLQRVNPIIKNLNFPHRPVVVAVASGNRLLFQVLAVGAFIPAPLRFRNYVRTSLQTPTLHYACIHAATSAPRGISSSFLTPHVPFFRPYPCPSSTHFQWLPSFLRRVSPNKTLKRK